MIASVITVGVTAVQVSPTSAIGLGGKLLARSANAGSVYVGTSSGVTTSTGVLLPKGNWGDTFPFVVPPEHFANGGQIWLIADQASQYVDWNAQ